ncbi:hypothetical protein L6164_037153 [Bauhinia variegata]|uniref:Uncharacterized protein n=1 Tax=Bauhinia variegata TaxID=167791 RepID=A0ACB9KJ65_BAUVA|nr:hypothetical protein L6164_037153 [Bauhinia variegata]
MLWRPWVHLPQNIFSALFSVKLDRGNYLLWKSMVLSLLRGHRLDGYILGTKPCPEPFITNERGHQPNPAYEEWVTTDQLLLGWLFNSMTSDIATQLLHCETSQQLWEAVQGLVGAHTRSKITLLKIEFHRTRKGGLKIEEYLNKMKGIADNLTLAGSPISNLDLITQTLSGLDNKYNAIVVQLTDKEELTWIEM